MRFNPHRIREEGGAAVILVASSLVMLMGFAAIAIDLGRGFNERRQDQSAADVGVMAGAIDVLSGPATMRDQALQFVRANLDTTYSNTEWRDIWVSCTDPNKNTGGFSFQAVPAPSGWGVSTLDCISIDPRGFFRVRVPDQIIETTFGRVLGVQTLSTNAAAIARFEGRGRGGILPFALSGTVGSGDHVCLSSGPAGISNDPCEGAASGNFGTLKSPLFGNPFMGTPQNCTSSPVGQVLSLNIAIGLDHLVGLYRAPGPEIRDICFNFPVNTLLTDTGFPNNDLENGLTGPLPSFSPPGALPRLRQSDNRVTYFGKSMDNVPLWNYIDPSLTASDIPASCVRSTFNNATQPDFDWDGNGTLDRPESWQHMHKCLKDYAAGSYAVLFLETIQESPRFAYVPQFFGTTLGSGSNWNRIERFRAVWLQGTWWKQGTNVRAFHPGEPCSSCSATNYSMIQLSGFVVPDSALPLDLRGDPPPWASGLNPFRPTLFR